ncbi:MAG: TldD/PmbA family protein [Syntrophomonadaceae bacterium]|jgi:TldD protein
MIEKDILEKVLNRALEKGGDFAEIYVEEKINNSIFCENNMVEKVNTGREKGAGIRVVNNGNTAYVYTNDLSEDGLLKAASTVSRAERAGVTRGTVLLVGSSCPDNGITRRTVPLVTPIDDKVKAVLDANKAAREVSGEIKQVTVSVADSFKKVLTANSEGELAEDERVRVRLAVNAVAARQNIIQTGYESAGGMTGWELFDQVNPEDLAVKAAGLAVKMLDARPAPAGSMPVVMSAQAGGTMVHEACGHGLEADLVQKGLSVYKGKMGEMVASKGVTVIDDATLPGKFGSYRFDDEGVAGQRTVLIDNGQLVGYMYDRITAARDGASSTGNGRRESYQHKPIPRMSNTVIAPGTDDPDEIIKSTEQGLLVKRMGGGQVNTTNGDFVFEVQEGYVIEAGEVKYAVRGATLIGNGPEALTNIDRVGSDHGFAIGTCGKDGQGVPVADAQPTIRIKRLTVGGTSVAGPTIKRIRRR